MSNFRRNNNSCGSQQYDAFMLGNRRGSDSSYRMPQMMSVNTMSSTPAQQRFPPNRTASLYDTTASVRECMYWPASLNRRGGNTMSAQHNVPYPSYQANNSGDFQYCSAPPKVYLSAPGGKGKHQQNIPCQIAPLGTDPSTLIKPMQPLTVRVQAPADLFTGNPSEPKTISISPAQLYGGGR